MTGCSAPIVRARDFAYYFLKKGLDFLTSI